MPRPRGTDPAPIVVLRTRDDVHVGHAVSFRGGQFVVTDGTREVASVPEGKLAHVVRLPRLEGPRGMTVAVLAAAVADPERAKRRRAGPRGDPLAALRGFKDVFFLRTDDPRSVFPRFARKLDQPALLAALCLEMVAICQKRYDAQAALGLLAKAEKEAPSPDRKFVFALMHAALTIQRGPKDDRRTLSPLAEQYPGHQDEIRLFGRILSFESRRPFRRRPPEPPAR